MDSFTQVWARLKNEMANGFLTSQNKYMYNYHLSFYALPRSSVSSGSWPKIRDLRNLPNGGLGMGDRFLCGSYLSNVALRALLTFFSLISDETK